jgi:hypothetical protein
MVDRELPDWTSSKMGTMVRAALWLVTKVGEGNVFTREQLRAAFPETAQVDRRVRDLRDHGWVIDTNREDPTLSFGESRFVHAGAPVWEPGSRRPVAARARSFQPEVARIVRRPDAESVWALLKDLSFKERSMILAWMAMGQRPSSPAERAWRAFRGLSDGERDELATKLGELVIADIADESEQ